MVKILSKKPDSARILQKAVDVAAFYGFQPYTDVIQQPKIVTAARTVCIPNEKVRSVDGKRKQGSIIDAYVKNENIQREEPKLVYFYTQLHDRLKGDGFGRFNLEIFGLKKSIAEATIIRSCLSILEEMGHTGMYLGINSIGDKESMVRFVREYTAYYRRRVTELHASCRENLKKNIWKISSCKNEHCISVREEAPQAIGCLTEPSRQHFREVLEFLEIMGAPYEIDNSILRDTDKYCETIFEVRHYRVEDIPLDEQKKQEPFVLAYGGRYNYLARKISGKKDIPAVGVSIPLQAGIAPEKLLIRNKRKPKVYFIQLGHEATQKSFPVLEILRKSRVPLLQSHGVNQLVGQLSYVEKMAIPYTIIMGQREAIDGTVIVRHTATRKQETIPTDKLSLYIEQLSL